MTLSCKLAFTTALLAFGFTSTSAQAAITDQEINALDTACVNVETVAQARPCLEPLYSRAMSMSDMIWGELHKNGSLDVKKMKNNQRESYLSGEYNNDCKDKQDIKLLQGHESINEYMRRAQICLSISAGLADRFGVQYDKEEASFLIARTRLRSRMSL